MLTCTGAFVMEDLEATPCSRSAPVLQGKLNVFHQFSLFLFCFFNWHAPCSSKDLLHFGPGRMPFRAGLCHKACSVISVEVLQNV